MTCASHRQARGTTIRTITVGVLFIGALGLGVASFAVPSTAGNNSDKPFDLTRGWPALFGSEDNMNVWTMDEKNW